MKEDILEQIATDYLNSRGYFTQTNIRYRPSESDPQWIGKQDGVRSDIDIVGLNPRLIPPQKVVTVSCKSWQSGFWAKWEMEKIEDISCLVSGRERWRAYRELASPKWARAFRSRVQELTGETDFEHWIVCTKFCDPQNELLWTQNETFQKNLTPHLKIVSLEAIFHELLSSTHTTPASSDVGRMIQVLRAAMPHFGVIETASEPDEDL